jgi:hypothetical protein
MALNSLQDEYWLPAEVARLLRISVKTLYNMRSRGQDRSLTNLGDEAAESASAEPTSRRGSRSSGRSPRDPR